MKKPFINDPSAYSTGEEYRQRRTEHLLTLGRITTKENKAEEALTPGEFMEFKKKFIRNQWPDSFKMREASNDATVLWKIEKEYNDWTVFNEKTSLVKKEEMYNAMRLKQHVTKDLLAVAEFKRFAEWNQNNYTTRQWSWLSPLSDKEFKQFVDKLQVDSVRSYNATGSFEECGCVIWKGQCSNRSGAPQFRRIDPTNTKRTKHPVKFLYHFHREKVCDGQGFVFKKICESDKCVNPYHYDYLTAVSAHKRRRLK